jgi:hypothetical protein
MKLTNADLSIFKPLEKLMEQLKIPIVHNWDERSKTDVMIPPVSKRTILNRCQRPEKSISGRNEKLDPTSRDKSPPFLLKINVEKMSLKAKTVSQLKTKKIAIRIGDEVVWLSGKTSKNLRLAWTATHAPRTTIIPVKGRYRIGLSDTERNTLLGRKIFTTYERRFEV